MRALYPELAPYHVRPLPVSPPHVLHVEACGNSAGIPVVFVHGGPGSGCKPYHRQFFDPNLYHIILFDQRGAGRSAPRGCVAANTTADLLEDMERIRAELDIDRWVLFGGSWGATLALLYAQRHPERVLGMILRGTFLARSRDLEWFFGGGVQHIFPDRWERFLAALEPSERQDVIAAYHRRIHDNPAPQALTAARQWADWSGAVVTYTLSGAATPAEPCAEELARTLDEARIETHYAVHGYFIEEDQILRDAARLPAVPSVIVHGRRDLTCTLEASWALRRAMRQSELVVLPDAGHLASEPSMIDALVTATDRLAREL